jgi:hypothetical protein
MIVEGGTGWGWSGRDIEEKKKVAILLSLSID